MTTFKKLLIAGLHSVTIVLSRIVFLTQGVGRVSENACETVQKRRFFSTTAFLLKRKR
jgi:hypothetical protein